MLLTESALAPDLAQVITPAQIRAARATLGWHQTELARLSGVSVMTIKKAERGKVDPRVSTLGRLQTAFEQAGIVFLEPGDRRGGGAGVRLKV
jgi:predicted transcriptional regulator